MTMSCIASSCHWQPCQQGPATRHLGPCEGTFGQQVTACVHGVQGRTHPKRSPSPVSGLRGTPPPPRAWHGMVATPEEPHYSTRYYDPSSTNSPRAQNFSQAPFSPPHSPWAPPAPSHPYHYPSSSPVRSVASLQGGRCSRQSGLDAAHGIKLEFQLILYLHPAKPGKRGRAIVTTPGNQTVQSWIGRWCDDI